jgi:KaiC/GvpD/RAD55 family RecA-like ATPase
MSLFQPAENTSAYLKMGLLGFAGSGKTKTASLTAIGLVQLMQARGVAAANLPTNFIDTETGSDWIKPDFDKAGIPLQIAKTRAFTDLLAAVRESEKGASVLIVDSVTHFWKELTDSYMKRKAAELNRQSYRLQFQDWAYLKGEWGKFTDAFVNSNLHIILCGRAGFEYDHIENEEDGKKELQKTGVKMKAEGEMGYEPSLLVFMERHQKIQGSTVAEVWREANVLKDRSTLLDGKSFVDPKFTDFLPHIKCLNLGGKHIGVDTSRTSEHAVVTDKKDWAPVQRRICLDEIQNLLVLHIPGQAAADKQRKVALLKQHFEAGWVEMEELMPLAKLRAGYDSLHHELEGKPSRYAQPVQPDNGKPIDALPDHSAGPTAPTQPAEPTKTGTPNEAALLAELAELNSVGDVMHWGLAVAKLDGIDTGMRMRLSDALSARLVVVNQAAKTEVLAEAGPEAGKPKPARKQRAGKGKDAESSEPEPALQAAGDGRLPPRAIWFG